MSPPLNLSNKEKQLSNMCFILHANLFGTDLCHWAHHLLEEKNHLFYIRDKSKIGQAGNDTPGMVIQIHKYHVL